MAGAGIKAINKRIRSVRATQQITKAMKMVAAAKLRRAQTRLLAGRPYAGKLAGLLGNLAESGLGGHPLLEARPAVKRRLYVVATSDKGLCGGYNLNVIKLAQAGLDEARRQGLEVAVYAVGKKARDYFGKRGYAVYEAHADFGGEVTADRAKLIADRCAQAFLGGEFDEVRLVYARFVSTLTQRPSERVLLPVLPPPAPTEAVGGARGGREAGASRPASRRTAGGGDGGVSTGGGGARAGEEGGAHEGPGGRGGADYIWEPEHAALLKVLMPLYARNQVYIALCEAFASEHGARMAAMTSATDNAAELIDFLTLKRNRERQASITQELSEIVGGANAL